MELLWSEVGHGFRRCGHSRGQALVQSDRLECEMLCLQEGEV